MKKITIIGIGLGLKTMTPAANEAIAQADVLFGAPRILKLLGRLPKPSYPLYLPKDIAAVVSAEDARKFVVLVSGDVGFYSTATGFVEVLDAYELHFIPGISTVNAFFARLRLPWQDAAFISVHGRDANIVDTVRRNHLTFCLTAGNVSKIAVALCNAGLGHIKTYVGENLGMDQERVHEAVADDLARGNFSSLTVLLFVNDTPDAGTPFGLPDSRFVRLEGIPMTKSETRAIVLSKLNLRPDFICWDVGAGTGSVTVEMALYAYQGHVYAVERREDAILLIRQNCRAFHIGNVTTVCGQAPDVLETLPPPDSVFIGGSGGEMQEIINAILFKNPRAGIVVTAVTIETVGAALSAFADVGMEPEIIQFNVARGKKVGASHLMETQNPITILSARGKI